MARDLNYKSKEMAMLQHDFRIIFFLLLILVAETLGRYPPLVCGIYKLILTPNFPKHLSLK
jgi:hypothetical protein